MTLVDLTIEVFVSVRVGEATGLCQRESASGRSSWRRSKGHVRHVVHRNSGTRASLLSYTVCALHDPKRHALRQRKGPVICNSVGLPRQRLTQPNVHLCGMSRMTTDDGNFVPCV